MTSTNEQAATVAEVAVDAPEDTFYCGLCRGWVAIADYSHGHTQKGNQSMATLYPTEKERNEIRLAARRGDESAKKYLRLLDILTDILENSNGITLARGLSGERDDVYGEAIDDALADLVPVIVEIAAGGWESLKFYTPAQESPEKEGGE